MDMSVVVVDQLGPVRRTYLVVVFQRQEFAHQQKSRLLLFAHATLHWPQIGRFDIGQQTLLGDLGRHFVDAVVVADATVAIRLSVPILEILLEFGGIHFTRRATGASPSRLTWSDSLARKRESRATRPIDICGRRIVVVRLLDEAFLGHVLLFVVVVLVVGHIYGRATFARRSTSLRSTHLLGR
jgi:hypothetical protein